MYLFVTARDRVLTCTLTTTMPFCRRCGNIVTGDRCKCGGFAVGKCLRILSER